MRQQMILHDTLACLPVSSPFPSVLEVATSAMHEKDPATAHSYTCPVFFGRGMYSSRGVLIMGLGLLQ